MAHPIQLSPQTIDALAEIISGGSAYNGKPAVGLYRSGPALERFMRECNVDFRVVGSRVPSLVDCLLGLHRDVAKAPFLARIVERAADPRDFVDQPDKLGWFSPT